MQIARIPEIGEVKLRKSARAKRIIIKVNHDGVPEVVVPRYVPYYVARQFAVSKKQWIQQHLPPNTNTIFQTGQQIGRFHKLYFKKEDRPSVASRVHSNAIYVTYPHTTDMRSQTVQAAAKKAIQRAIKKEADAFLPQILHQLARRHGYNYRSVSVKNMKTRWGSCSSEGVICLNMWLVQMPDELIEYVCCHELAHLNHQHHQPAFWQELATTIPEYKILRGRLKKYSPRLQSSSPAST